MKKKRILEDEIIQSGVGIELQSANNDFDWLMESPPSLPEGASKMKSQNDEIMAQKYQTLQHEMKVFLC